MFEILLGVGLAATTVMGVAKIRESRETMAGPRIFKRQFAALTAGQTLACANCGCHLVPENTGVLYSENGEKVLGVCKDVTCLMSYMHTRRPSQAA